MRPEAVRNGRKEAGRIGPGGRTSRTGRANPKNRSCAQSSIHSKKGCGGLSSIPLQAERAAAGRGREKRAVSGAACTDRQGRRRGRRFSTPGIRQTCIMPSAEVSAPNPSDGNLRAGRTKLSLSVSKSGTGVKIHRKEFPNAAGRADPLKARFYPSGKESSYRKVKRLLSDSPCL